MSSNNNNNDEVALQRFDHNKFAYYGIQWDTYLQNLALRNKFYRDPYDETPFFHVCMAGSIVPTSVVRSVMQIFCNDKEYLCWKNKNGATAFHAACRCGSSYDVMELLLRECPRLASIPLPCGTYPLHIALSSGLDIDVIRLILRYDPSVALKKDGDGCIPLTRFWRDIYWNKKEMIDYLEQIPEAPHPPRLFKRFMQYWDISMLLVRANGSSSSLHDIVSYPQCPPALVHLSFIMGYKPDVRSFDDAGRLPLHSACANAQEWDWNDFFCDSPDPPSSWAHLPYRHYHDSHATAPQHHHKTKSQTTSVIEVLYREYPTAIGTPEKLSKRLPLHLAICNGWKRHSIRNICHYFPDALRIPDPKTGLYPFMLIAVIPPLALPSDSCHDDDLEPTKLKVSPPDHSLTAIYELLLDCPDILQYHCHSKE